MPNPHLGPVVASTWPASWGPQPACPPDWVLFSLPSLTQGGAALETYLETQPVSLVVELNLTELAAELGNSPFSAGVNRLTRAAMAGIPQLLTPGGLDVIAYPSLATLPASRQTRPRVTLEDGTVLVRTSAEECDRLGLELAQKACAARGPTVIVFPTTYSFWSRPGGPLYDPEADLVLKQSLENWLAGVRVVESAWAIDTAEFFAELTREIAPLRLSTHPRQ